ncbi:hypothetical protein SSX86_011243 [Deinandra increscens subsp. villosa]|uniref:RRM domain-containing protein n=1 Tax=Deinandra increscens subsp. villosa TaxID=3103831 RepID=A0AAP0D670_9ASTR
MATISSSILSSTTYLHRLPNSKSLKPQLPVSSKSNPNLPQTHIRFQFSPLISNPRQPTRLFCVAEETPATVTVDPSSEAARRLYVGNIPRTTTNDELQKVFEEHGAIEKVEVKTVARIVEGDVGKAICKEAERVKPAAVVMGTRGRSLIKSVLKGSVSEYCFHNCKSAPVIIVPDIEAGEESVISLEKR